ncbi:hypothetical protein B296_00028441 [Ensete ventricosum]|uniref:NAC domain-containing protein n=1 Tax=Ensete ventricosum TaxID=4639 RepID=A0A426YY14_ENSVE|nr:hypothetical protein B296_00028441 [Ensete ventricosum]
MASAASSSASTGVPPGFRFHPTDEELLLYYLKKKVCFEKFELEVIREVDLNSVELKLSAFLDAERCRIGSAAQDEWYFFSHKDRKYPTGSRTNRATGAGFWKATGRDKCIRNSYERIGMRKTLVFYRGRAPHGQKTDWIMHEYRLDDSDDARGGGSVGPFHLYGFMLACSSRSDLPLLVLQDEGWVVCRVSKKKCFFKGSGEGRTSQATENHVSIAASHDRSPSLSSHYIHPNLAHHHRHLHHHNGLYHSQMPTGSYSHGQVQDLMTNHRPSGYDFGVIPGDSAPIVKPYDGALAAAAACVGMQSERDPGPNEWAVLDGITAQQQQQQMNQMGSQRGGEMDLWGYGK